MQLIRGGSCFTTSIIFKLARVSFFDLKNGTAYTPILLVRDMVKQIRETLNNTPCTGTLLLQLLETAADWPASSPRPG